MNNKLTTLLLAGLLAAAPLAQAQDPAAGATDMTALRAAVKADKKALVASTLALTPDEARRFWPIYDEYQRTLDAANRQRTLVAEDLLDAAKPPTDLYAKTLATELIAADDAEFKARRTMQTAVMKALPPRKAVRYMQIESKIRAFIAYDVAAAFPLLR